MWKRENEGVTGSAPQSPTPGNPVRHEPEPAPSTPTRSAGESGQRAVLSPSIVVRGEVSGDEDLVVEGRIEGKISLRQNAVTVGAKGRVQAEIHARAISIEGEVDGNLTADESIVLKRSSKVKGDLTSPRVTIEDGARFKGAIDMEPKKAMGATVSAPGLRPTAPVKEEGAVARPNEAKAAQAS
jgi:cytoskeletal protein CcmA (bactofilin family)